MIKVLINISIAIAIACFLNSLPSLAMDDAAQNPRISRSKRDKQHIQPENPARNTSFKMTNKNQPRDAIGKQKCRFFNGQYDSCSYGNKCNFLHSGPSPHKTVPQTRLKKESPEEYRARHEKMAARKQALGNQRHSLNPVEAEPYFFSSHEGVVDNSIFLEPPSAKELEEYERMDEERAREKYEESVRIIKAKSKARELGLEVKPHESIESLEQRVTKAFYEKYPFSNRPHGRDLPDGFGGIFFCPYGKDDN